MSNVVNSIQLGVFEYIAKDDPYKSESKQVMGKMSIAKYEMLSEEEISNLTDVDSSKLLNLLRPHLSLVIVKSSKPEQGEYCIYNVEERLVHNLLGSEFPPYFSDEKNLDMFLLALPIAAIAK